jgi:phenylacetate-coenzyme A ligase PaaK-like adenylate-forming protein
MSNISTDWEDDYLENKNDKLEMAMDFFESRYYKNLHRQGKEKVENYLNKAMQQVPFYRNVKREKELCSS